MYLRLFIVLITISYIESYPTVQITCFIENDKWLAVGEVTRCKFKDIITERATEVSNIILKPSNRFKKPFPNDKVQGIFADKSVVKYFPRNFDKFFKNIIAIEIYDSGLIEISREDLAPFVKLRNINLSMNKLKFIESDLFKYNRELEVVWLHDNEINFIAANVFDNLPKLSYINLNKNGKGDMFVAQNSLSDVAEILKKVNVDFFDENFILSRDDRLMERFNLLKNDSEALERSKIENNLIKNEISICETTKNETIAELQEINQEKLNLTSEVSNLNGINHKLDEKVNEVEKKLEEENENYKNEMEKLQNVNTNQELLISDCKNNLTDIENQLKTETDKNIKLDVELELKHREFDDKIDEKDSQIKNLKIDIESFVNQTKDLKNLAENQKTLIETLQTESAEEKSTISTQKSQIHALNDTITKLNEMISHNTTQIKEILNELTKCVENKTETSDYGKKIEQESKECAANLMESQKQYELLSREKTQHEADNSILESQINVKNEEIKNLTENNELLKSQNENLASQLIQMNEKFDVMLKNSSNSTKIQDDVIANLKAKISLLETMHEHDSSNAKKSEDDSNDKLVHVAGLSDKKLMIAFAVIALLILTNLITIICRRQATGKWTRQLSRQFSRQMSFKHVAQMKYANMSNEDIYNMQETANVEVPKNEGSTSV